VGLLICGSCGDHPFAKWFFAGGQNAEALLPEEFGWVGGFILDEFFRWSSGANPSGIWGDSREIDLQKSPCP
jgi:hypothetical protein